MLAVGLYEGSGDGRPNGVTSTPSLTWTSRAAPADLIGDTQGVASSIWTSTATAAGTHAVSFTVANFSTATATLMEVRNLDTASPLDASTTNTGTSTTVSTGTTAATTRANAIAIAHCVINTVSATTFTTPTGYTNAGRHTNSSATGLVSSCESRVLSATGTQSASWTISPSAENWAASIVVLKGAA